MLPRDEFTTKNNVCKNNLYLSNVKFELKYIYFVRSIQILDWVLGHNEALFRRAQLKALVSIHSQEVIILASCYNILFIILDLPFDFYYAGLPQHSCYLMIL